jgi:glycosyltransferase involved in cell wall biosynthesis
VAQIPYFVLGPNTLLSIVGLMRGGETTAPTPARNWRTVTVDVVIPAFNEQDNIVRCLASLVGQTMRPRKIVVVDDGSSDHTASRAVRFGSVHGLDVLVIKRAMSIGKTPSIKDQTRALDSDVVFVLDADTILESDNYIERTVQELYQGVGIASACGSILPLREKDRRAADAAAPVRAFVEASPSYEPRPPKNWLRRSATAITNTYREVLYLFLQRFVFRGQMAVFGTVANPAGCAVAYRRAYLEQIFDTFEPSLGDDLTNSEDIFIGLAMLNEGYRNVQVLDVCARTVEPEVQRLPKQLSLWSSAFFQSAFYFDELLRSPFKGFRRHLHRGPRNRSGGALQVLNVSPRSVAYAAAGPAPTSHAFLTLADLPNAVTPPPALVGGSALPAGAGGIERRYIQEPYRQAFGAQHTKKYGRPAGWMLLASAIEKIALPTSLLIMVLLAAWEPLMITIAAETLLTVTALAIVMKRRWFEYFVKGIAVTPLRYGLLLSEVTTIARFTRDLWLTGNRRWRK